MLRLASAALRLLSALRLLGAVLGEVLSVLRDPLGLPWSMIQGKLARTGMLQRRRRERPDGQSARCFHCQMHAHDTIL